MSMLSSMTDRLRKTADKVENFWHRNNKWLWIDASTITRAVVELRDAADTIDYLRNTCNDLQRDNEKLKALVRDMWDVALHPQLFGDGSHLRRRMHDLGVEVDDE